MTESLGEFTVTARASHRDESGRFVSQVHQGAIDAAEEGGKLLQKMVMSAILGEGQVRSGELLGSVNIRGGGTRVEVYSGSDHAAPLEEGARPHNIPNAFGWGITVHHPGNRAYRFFKTATTAFAPMFTSIVREHMP